LSKAMVAASVRLGVALLAACLAIVSILALEPAPASAQTSDPGFAISNQSFWDYYQKRGGMRGFGNPISWQFTLQGYQVQLYQRGVLQLQPDGSVAGMNLLDSDLMPYTSFNYSVVPAPDRDLMQAAPSPADPDYARRAMEFVQAYVPDEWGGSKVGFLRNFMSTVRMEDAFPDGGGDPALLPLLNLELWGLPTSWPALDPNNTHFVYQRFQRGIMHYDSASGVTQGLLLGDYLKSVLTGQGLPPDVEDQAAGSRFLRQYDPSTMQGPRRPAELPASDLSQAFKPGWGDPRFGVVIAGPGSDDAQCVAASLAALGAGSWSTFTGSNAQVAGRVEMVRPGGDMVELATRARARPGSAWLIGNEPNVPGQDDLTPEAYADFLWRVGTAIKGADPTAVLVGPNVLNWEVTCTGCPGFAKGRDWSESFVAAYQDRHGKLPLDVWGMHSYSLDWDHLPMASSATDQAQIEGARAWLDSRGTGLPIWLTEFGVIWGYESIDWGEKDGKPIARPGGRYREDLLGAYLDDMLGWLGAMPQPARVERSFLYATAPPPEPYASRFAGIGLLEPRRLNLTPLGERYRAQATHAKAGP